MGDFTYQTGDIVSCKLELGEFAYSDSKEYDTIQKFEIIAVCENGYLLLVPPGLYLTRSFTLTKKDCRVYGIGDKFIGTDVAVASGLRIHKLIKRLTGFPCDECGIFCEYAEVNRLDGNGKGIYICWNCRNYRHYRHYH